MVRTATELPPEADPYWIDQAAALMPYLTRKPRDWATLKAWAKKKKMKEEKFRRKENFFYHPLKLVIH